MQQIDCVWAFVTDDLANNEEGLIGISLEGQWFPFVCTKLENFPAMRERATRIAKQMNKEVKVLKFSNREVVETL